MKKGTLFKTWQPSFVLCVTRSGGCQLSHDGLVHCSFQVTANTKADLVFKTDWCLSELFVSLHLFQLYCLCFTIVVLAKDDLVDHVSLSFAFLVDVILETA